MTSTSDIYRANVIITCNLCFRRLMTFSGFARHLVICAAMAIVSCLLFGSVVSAATPRCNPYVENVINVALDLPNTRSPPRTFDSAAIFAEAELKINLRAWAADWVRQRPEVNERYYSNEYLSNQCSADRNLLPSELSYVGVSVTIDEISFFRDSALTKTSFILSREQGSVPVRKIHHWQRFSKGWLITAEQTE